MMKKIIYIVFLCVMAIGLAGIVSAQVPEEGPFYSVGSDFLVMKNQDLQPEIFTLFSNTNIYLDNENDGVWDYQFSGNAGQNITIDPPGVAVANTGGLIHSDKPVGYRQKLFYYYYYNLRGGLCGAESDLINHYAYCPPLNSLKSEYYIYNGTWYVVAFENTTVYVDANIDGTIDQTFNVSNGQRRPFTVVPPAKVYSASPILVYNSVTVGGIKSNDFFTALENIRLIVTEDNTEVKFDLNNDDAYDQSYTLNRGQYAYTLTQGAHINANKPITVFTNYPHTITSYGYSGGCYDKCYVSAMPVKTTGSDIWGQYGSYNYVFGLYNQYSGLHTNTTYHLDRQTENDLVANYNGTIISNTNQQLSDYGNTHIWSDMPLLTSYYRDYYYPVAGYICYSNYHYFSPPFPYSVIYATSWPNNKIMGTNEIASFTARAFNPFAATDITSVQLKIKIPSAFSIPGGNVNVAIEKRNIVNDAVISSGNAVKTPSLAGDYYEFTITSSDTGLFSNLNHFEYYNLGYSVTTPADYGTYKFPVEITYNSDTWQK